MFFISYSYVINYYILLVTVSILSLFNGCLPGYPYKCPKLHIIPKNGLSETDADKLFSLLHDQVVVESFNGCSFMNESVVVSQKLVLVL